MDMTDSQKSCCNGCHKSTEILEALLTELKILSRHVISISSVLGSDASKQTRKHQTNKMNAYNVYTKEMIKRHENIGSKELFAKIALEYRSLSHDEKMAYKQKAEELNRVKPLKEQKRKYQKKAKNKTVEETSDSKGLSDDVEMKFGDTVMATCENSSEQDKSDNTDKNTKKANESRSRSTLKRVADLVNKESKTKMKKRKKHKDRRERDELQRQSESDQEVTEVSEIAQDCFTNGLENGKAVETFENDEKHSEEERSSNENGGNKQTIEDECFDDENNVLEICSEIDSIRKTLDDENDTFKESVASKRKKDEIARHVGRNGRKDSVYISESSVIAADMSKVSVRKKDKIVTEVREGSSKASAFKDNGLLNLYSKHGRKKLNKKGVDEKKNSDSGSEKSNSDHDQTLRNTKSQNDIEQESAGISVESSGNSVLSKGHVLRRSQSENTRVKKTLSYSILEGDLEHSNSDDKLTLKSHKNKGSVSSSVSELMGKDRRNTVVKASSTQRFTSLRDWNKTRSNSSSSSDELESDIY